MVKYSFKSGYTLIELTIVLAIISIIAGIAFFGFSGYNQEQVVRNAQQELITNLRSVQNQVVNGSDGVAIKSVILNNGANSYTIVDDQTPTTRTVSLPANITISTASTVLCFVNQNVTAYTNTRRCFVSTTNACVSGSGYICDPSNFSASGPSSQVITLTHTNGTNKSITINGSGMQINQIYAN